MSYAASLALQEAVFDALTGAPALMAQVAGVYDAPVHADAPEGAVGAYVTLGDERAQAWTAQGLAGSAHEIDVSVHSPADGFAEAKRIGAAVSEACLGPLAPSLGHVVTAEFIGARTRRVKDGGRRIDLRFRYRIEMPPT